MTETAIQPITNVERHSVLESKGVPIATSISETIKKADLNWKVLDGPCVTPHPKSGKNIEMARKKILYRSDTYEALGVVGTDYKPSDPKEFVESQFSLAAKIGGNVTRLGWTERRAKAFCCIRLKEEITLPKNLRKVGDPVAAYIYSTDGWDGGTPRQSKLFLERLSCLNGMTTRELAESLWVSHTSEMETRYTVEIGKFHEEVDNQLSELRDQFVKLAKDRMDEVEMKAFLEKLLPGDSGHSRNKREQILHLFGNGAGNQASSRWDALNAVTEYTTHVQTYRDSKIADAATSRFLGVLGRNSLNDKAMELLLN